MKRLIFLIFTIICAAILYTCASPLGVDALPSTAIGSFYSSKPIINGGTGGNSTYLGINITQSGSLTRINIGFSGGNSGTFSSGDEISSSIETNTISGTYPNISFQNGLISGTIKFTGEDQLKITFQQRIYPYLKMWDVVCENNP